MMNKILVSILLSLLFFGCAQPPTPEQMQNADYGREISMSEATSIIQAWFELRLKDSQSAQYKIGYPNKGYLTNSILFGGRTAYGYLVDASVNAKNSYGGYTGFRAHKFIIKDGQVIAATAQDWQTGAFLPIN